MEIPIDKIHDFMKSYDLLNQRVAEAKKLLLDSGLVEDLPTPQKLSPKSKVQEQIRKFKTQKCKHFDNGGCLKADKCHFAHGDGEIKVGSQNGLKKIKGKKGTKELLAEVLLQESNSILSVWDDLE